MTEHGRGGAVIQRTTLASVQKIFVRSGASFRMVVDVGELGCGMHDQ